MWARLRANVVTIAKDIDTAVHETTKELNVTMKSVSKDVDAKLSQSVDRAVDKAHKKMGDTLAVMQSPIEHMVLEHQPSYEAAPYQWPSNAQSSALCACRWNSQFYMAVLALKTAVKSVPANITAIRFLTDHAIPKVSTPQLLACG